MKYGLISLLILLAGCANRFQLHVIDAKTQKPLEGVQVSWSSSRYSVGMNRKEAYGGQLLTNSRGVATTGPLFVRSRIYSFRFDKEGYLSATMNLASWVDKAHLWSPSLDVDGKVAEAVAMPLTNSIFIPMYPREPGDHREEKDQRKIF